MLNLCTMNIFATLILGFIRDPCLCCIKFLFSGTSTRNAMDKYDFLVNKDFENRIRLVSVHGLTRRTKKKKYT